jgi:UDP-sulfoquinovose synthase
VGKELGLSIKAESIANPRLEKEEHYYNVEHNKLKQLGFRPIRTIEKTIYMMLTDLLSHRDILVRNKNVILPKTTWINGIIGTPTPIRVDQV